MTVLFLILFRDLLSPFSATDSSCVIVFVLQLLNTPSRQLEDRWRVNISAVFCTCPDRSKLLGTEYFPFSVDGWSEILTLFHSHTFLPSADSGFKVPRRYGVIVFSSDLRTNHCRTSDISFRLPGWLLRFHIYIMCLLLQSLVAKEIECTGGFCEQMSSTLHSWCSFPEAGEDFFEQQRVCGKTPTRNDSSSADFLMIMRQTVKWLVLQRLIFYVCDL